MPDQVIRYDSEQQYLDFKNQRTLLSTGKVLGLPSWEDEPDAYWKAYYAYKKEPPGCILAFQTTLLSEVIEDGVLQSQHVEYTTLAWDTASACRLNRNYISANTKPDPGTPVSAKFESKKDAERMRHLLLQGEPGYYYGIKHFTHVAIITLGDKDAE